MGLFRKGNPDLSTLLATPRPPLLRGLGEKVVVVGPDWSCFEILIPNKVDAKVFRSI